MVKSLPTGLRAGMLLVMHCDGVAWSGLLKAMHLRLQEREPTWGEVAFTHVLCFSVS